MTTLKIVREASLKCEKNLLLALCKSLFGLWTGQQWTEHAGTALNSAYTNKNLVRYCALTLLCLMLSLSYGCSSPPKERADQYFKRTLGIVFPEQQTHDAGKIRFTANKFNPQANDAVGHLRQQLLEAIPLGTHRTAIFSDEQLLNLDAYSFKYANLGDGKYKSTSGENTRTFQVLKDSPEDVHFRNVYESTLISSKWYQIYFQFDSNKKLIDLIVSPLNSK